MMRSSTVFPCLLAALALLGSAPATAGEPASMVFLNGEAVPVFFNDGDSFRVLSGSKKGAKARIAGYNTLETHGPVHSWGSWTAKEMYVLAKMATMHARRGKWTCTTDGKTDTYGRMLTFCPDLGEALVRRGLAHALSITDEPADPKLMAAQKEAMDAGRGIWAHGKPLFVVTSIHSAEEDIHGKGTYNRLVSTEDGHSATWKHTNRYKECEKVCHKIYSFDESRLGSIAKEVRKDAALKKLTSSLDDDDLWSMLADYARYRIINRKIPRDQREKTKEALERLADKGIFGEQSAEDGSCMVHVPFERRFGGTRAACMRK